MQRHLRSLQPIQPPATLGVIGGGQLGRFFALAAQGMGYRVAVLDPDAGSPAMQVADLRIAAPYNDPAALDRLADACAAVTVEFESVPAGSVAHVERRCVAAPRAESIAVLQDRIREKRFLRGIGLPVVPFAPVIAADDVAAAGCYPGILKLARQSYDGKGQVVVSSASEALGAWRNMGEAACVLERRMALESELSVVLARAADGDTRLYPAAENRHCSGILELSVVPARVAPWLAGRAAEMAMRIADCLDYVGVLAVEFFVSEGALLVNEIAPRPHNSGHFSLDACGTSQFEQQVRALCGMPLGDPALRSGAAMINILGDAWRGGEPDWAQVLGDSGGALHLYGKVQARPRRKMGHITVMREQVADALEEAEGCLARLANRDVARHSLAA